MNILLFGGTGFIGEHLAKKLSARKDCKITSVGSSNINEGNYLDAEVIVVLTQPGTAVRDVLIQKITASKKLKKIIYLSSLLIYPDSPRPQNEKVVPMPATEYERSKYKEELKISRFAKTIGCSLTVIRMANVYGDIKNLGILNNIFLSLIHGHDFIIRGDGNKIVRDYVFVEDAAGLIEFFIFLKQKNQREVVNVSTGKGYTVRDLIGMVENITGKEVYFKVGSPTPEKKFSIGDNKKMLKLTNYKFNYSLHDGLQIAYKNYLRYYKHYASAHPYIAAREKKYVMEVLNSGILSMGHKLKAFEKKFAEFAGTKYACGVSSGTAGLHLALLAAKIGSGDEVITTPFSFVASANVILYVAAKPVFVDIDPITYNIDPNKIESAITKKTKAILIVHIFGQPADMHPILQIAQKYNLKVIEDACESLGATYKGRKAGTFGESAVFAFYPNKQMTTGEGGVIVTNSKNIYRLCASLRNQGRSENMQWLDHKYLGYNYRMDEMSAAVGLAQLEKLDWLLKERKIAGWYNKFLAPYSDLVQVPQVHKYNTHTWFVYVVRIKNIPDGKAGKKVNRDKVIEYLNEIGISTKPYLPSIHLLSFYKKSFGFKPGDFPVCEAVSNSAVALPFYIGLKKADIEYISKTLAEVIQKYAKRV